MPSTTIGLCHPSIIASVSMKGKIVAFSNSRCKVGATIMTKQNYCSHSLWQSVQYCNLCNRHLKRKYYEGGLPGGDFLACPRNIFASIVTSTMFILLLCITQLNFVSAQQLSYKSPKNPLTTIVIPHIKYGQGLNRWSFLSTDRTNHGLYSDLLCPNPMLPSPASEPGGYNNRAPAGAGWGIGSTTRQQQYQQGNRFQGGGVQSSLPLPNEIWAVKTNEGESLLPCSLRQYSVPSPPYKSQNGGTSNHGISSNTVRGNVMPIPTRHNNGHFIENRILLINVSLVPFNYYGALPCSKYIKLMYDEEEGTNLKCRDIPFTNSHSNNYHIKWPDSSFKKRDYWSILENLESFLKTEKLFRRQFYFQLYFTSYNGRSKRCIVQQYELDLSYPAGNSRYCNLTGTAGGYDELCGEFNCDDLIFPLYADPQPHSGSSDDKSKHSRDDTRHNMGDGDDVDEYYIDSSDGDEIGNDFLPKMKTEGINEQGVQGQSKESAEGFSWVRMIKMDMRLLVFITIVPLVLFGVLVFGLELIVYFMCCRKRQDGDGEGGERAQQLLENSLNVWENVPSRMDAQRTHVSFSPMTTSIYGREERKHNIQLMDAASLDNHPETPKILKSALKKGGDHSSPTTTAHHYFEYDHDMPPSYIETTGR